MYNYNPILKIGDEFEIINPIIHPKNKLNNGKFIIIDIKPALSVKNELIYEFKRIRKNSKYIFCYFVKDFDEKINNNIKINIK